MSEPPVKRSRNAPEKIIPALNPVNLEPKNQAKLQKEIEASEPYKYGVIHNLLNDELLRKARDEILSTLHFTQKETDIYRVNQTGDLANLARLGEEEQNQLAYVGQLRDALYSPEFRKLMSQVTQCGPLSGKIQDLSINLYDKGCHLLNHDDVIGTRRVSYILYLVPPDEAWDPKWGGALRLYPTIRPGVPAPDWTVAVPPAWNQLSFFKIQPGKSFHDVEEVYVDKPRLSISGWFHVPQEGEEGFDPAEEEDREKAGLAQLSKAHDTNDGYEPERVFKPFGSEKPDDAYLRKFVNPTILENLEKHAETFGGESLLELDDFLAPEFAAQLLAEAEDADLAKLPQRSTDVALPWNTARPPHLRRYLYLEADKANVNSALTQLHQFLNSTTFANFLQRISQLVPEGRYVEVRRFVPGQGFTLASTSGVAAPILEAVISFTPAKWNDNVGGYDLVMPGNEENDDPAIYRAASEDDSPLVTQYPVSNKLTLIYRDEDLLRFVKYVSRNAPGSRWDAIGQYTVQD